MTIDIATNTLMQSIENPTLTFFSKIVAQIFDPIILILIAIIIAVYLYAKVSKKQGILLATTAIATGIIIKISKEIFQRARPLNSIIPEFGFSMPSGHSTSAVVFFGLITYLLISKKHKLTASIITTPIILSISFTRIYLRVHWLTDIIAGITIGVIILTSSILISKKLS